MVFWRSTAGSVWLHSVAKDVSSYYINIPRSNLNRYHSRISDITETNNLLNESHFLNYIPECILSDYIHPNHNQICASHFLLQRTGQKTQRKTAITTLVSLTTLADVYYRTCNFSHQPGSREGGVGHNYAISESHSGCVNSGLAKRPLLRSRIISGRDFCNVAQVKTSQNARASRPVLHISADSVTLERRLENVYLAIFVQKSTSQRCGKTSKQGITCSIAISRPLSFQHHVFAEKRNVCNGTVVFPQLALKTIQIQNPEKCAYFNAEVAETTDFLVDPTESSMRIWSSGD
ncbi:Hypothetical_protein [Hexamita inflata]|uniref:Hypothetical_protein n=1 Tax=Hexamita inflata TaxID=28002 RepID=A0AA86PCE3_9EUKA|nr:Hypothetical protein HINF_LOCUS21219 [Hexamita inflata]